MVMELIRINHSYIEQNSKKKQSLKHKNGDGTYTNNPPPP